MIAVSISASSKYIYGKHIIYYIYSNITDVQGGVKMKKSCVASLSLSSSLVQYLI